MCCLRPGIPGLSETISVRSIVGEFLEHSRIYCFGCAEDDGGAEVLIGSADMMERNLDRRIEAVVPIDDPKLRDRLVEIMRLTFLDETNTWLLGPDRRWRRLSTAGARSVQQELKDVALADAHLRAES